MLLRVMSSSIHVKRSYRFRGGGGGGGILKNVFAAKAKKKPN